MINSVTLVGNIANDPKIIEMKDGSTSVAKFTIVTQKRIKKKNSDEYENKPTFVEVDAWGHLATFIRNNFEKGTPIAMTGELFNDNYEADGKKVYRLRAKAMSISFTPFDNSGKKSNKSEELEEVPF
jgi:single-strand DNA-binding protein